MVQIYWYRYWFTSNCDIIIEVAIIDGIPPKLTITIVGRVIGLPEVGIIIHCTVIGIIQSIVIAVVLASNLFIPISGIGFTSPNLIISIVSVGGSACGLVLSLIDIGTNPCIITMVGIITNSFIVIIIMVGIGADSPQVIIMVVVAPESVGNITV